MSPTEFHSPNLSWNKEAEEIIEQLKDYYQVYIFDEDVEVYQKYMSQLPDDVEVIDLATGWGKAVAAMALANPNVYITTIDNMELVQAMGWSKDSKEYFNKLRELWDPYDIKNIDIIVADVMTYEPKNEYLLINMDLNAATEQQALKRWKKYLKPGGIFLVRNYFRFSKEADEILKGWEKVENKGQIQVFKKP